MSEEKKEVPLSKLVEDGEIALFEGQPFTGVGVDYYDNGKKEYKEQILIIGKMHKYGLRIKLKLQLKTGLNI